MKTKLFIPVATIVLGLFMISCSSMPGKKVKEPFSGSKYQTNNKYFRAKGIGESKSQQVSKNKAMTQAKSNLAGSVKSNMKRVADAYIAETTLEDKSEVMEKFQSLSREVVSQEIADIRTIGEETYINEETYKTNVALEIKKKSMYKVMKKLAKLEEKKYDAKTVQEYQKMLDKEIERLEALEADED